MNNLIRKQKYTIVKACAKAGMVFEFSIMILGYQARRGL
jgi:hypothetical protein